jgi:putative tryptophan/tyrosine transport system substrate-binding protein
MQVTTRRRFLGAAATGLLMPRWAHAQAPFRVARIGWLTPEVIEVHSRAFRDAMLALGYVEGKSYVVDTRSAAGDLDRLRPLAAELVAAKVDVIVAVAPPSIRAAKAATDTIPIVMAFWGSGGLIESGMIASLARPGGNVTGVTMLAAELEAKRLEFLLQAVPKARRIAVLDSGMAPGIAQVQKVAAGAGAQLFMTPVGAGDAGYQRAFEAMAREHIEGLLVPSFPRFFEDRRQIIELAAANRIPAIYEWPTMADDGGLMAYGPTFNDLEGRAASFVVRILKGDKPGVLPIEQPSKFELVVNLMTAKALGIAIPQPLLLRADRVIQQ